MFGQTDLLHFGPVQCLELVIRLANHAHWYDISAWPDNDSIES